MLPEEVSSRSVPQISNCFEPGGRKPFNFSVCSSSHIESAVLAESQSVRSAYSSAQFICLVSSHSLRPHGLQHARPPCPSPTSRVRQTHVHRVRDVIQPSHPLSSPSPPALNLSLHQGLFQWVSSSHEVAKVLEFQLQHQSLLLTPRTDLL